MAKGRQGFYLEGWKFAVYLLIPIGASWYYNDPQRQKAAADYWQYVQYPANPNTNMKEQLKELQAQKEQRQAYREQMKELQKQAAKSRREEVAVNETKGGWRRWLGLSR